MTFVSILITLIAFPHMTVWDIFVCFLAFMPAGWGLLLVGESYTLCLNGLCLFLSQILKDLGIMSLESLKKELIEANETKGL